MKCGDALEQGDWREQKRAEVFETTLRGLEQQRSCDASFNFEEVRGRLAHLYVAEGNDMLGRGELGDIVLQATIAAYEHFIHTERHDGSRNSTR